MSSAKQDASIGQQRDQLLAYAQQHGYQVVAEYVDQAISGDDTAHRAEFLRMRDDAGRGGFEVVLCWDQDRFGRFDPIEGGYWILPFRDAGVRLETIAQGKIDWTDFAGRLLYVVQQEAKHAYLKDLSRNVARGTLAAARNGKRHGTGGGGPRLFGYRTAADGRVEIVEDEAVVVRRIFASYLKPGCGLRAVAADLNQAGIKTLAGNGWTVTRIRSILTNRKFTGAYTRFKTSTGKYHGIVNGEIVTRSRTDKAVEQDPLIVVEGNHEPIVDLETFEAAQTKLAGNKTETAHKNAYPYAFRSLLRCSECGGSMVGHGGHAYICETYKRSGSCACHSNYVDEGTLLAGIVRLIRNRYCSEARIEELREAVRLELADERRRDAKPDQRVDQSRLRKRISILDRQLDQAAERVLTAPAAVVDRLTSKLAELQAERDRLQGELDAGEAHSQQPERLDEETVEAAIEALRTLQQRLSDADPAELRQLLKTLIVRISLEFTHEPTSGGKRTKNRLSGGKILVRPDQSLSSLLFNTAGRS